MFTDVLSMDPPINASSISSTAHSVTSPSLPGLRRSQTKDMSELLAMLSKIPSHARTSMSPGDATTLLISGTATTNCSVGGMSLRALYILSPNARATAICELILPPMTLPPAFSMRSFSCGKFGEWSCVNAFHFPSERKMKARLSPTLQTMISKVTSISSSLAISSSSSDSTSSPSSPGRSRMVRCDLLSSSSSSSWLLSSSSVLFDSPLSDLWRVFTSSDISAVAGAIHPSHSHPSTDASVGTPGTAPPSGSTCRAPRGLL